VVVGPELETRDVPGLYVFDWLAAERLAARLAG
jgi:hypothetical protein